MKVLNPALTTDGGHLNTEGEKQVTRDYGAEASCSATFDKW